MKILDFNSHAHVERDSIGVNANFNMKHFNSHAHVERDRYQEHYPYISKHHFNSHAHVERDGQHNMNKLQNMEFQLTRSRGA